VGRPSPKITPTPAEQDALDDLNNHSKRPTDYAPYDR